MISHLQNAANGTFFGLFLTLILPILAVVTSCANRPMQNVTWTENDLLMTDRDSLIPPEQISSEARRRDSSLLIYALERGYGGRDFIPGGIWKAALDSLRKIEESSESPMATKEFCQQIAVVLGRIPDSHLSATIGSHNCLPGYQLKGQVGANINAGARIAPWLVRWETVQGGKIPILAINQMKDVESPEWKGIKETVENIKKTARALIIDLRGNSGGSDMVPMEVARILYGGDFPKPLGDIVKSLTPQTLAFRVNSYAYKIRKLKEQNKPVPDYLHQKIHAAYEQYQASRQGKGVAVEIQKDISPPSAPFSGGFGKPIYVLIDRICASACESMLEFLEAYPSLSLVGENTAGAMHFGNVGKLALHESQIVVGIATDFWRFKDGRFWEKKGYTPTIKVPSGKDAMDAALADFEKRI